MKQKTDTASDDAACSACGGSRVVWKDVLGGPSTIEKCRNCDASTVLELAGLHPICGDCQYFTGEECNGPGGSREGCECYDDSPACDCFEPNAERTRGANNQ